MEREYISIENFDPREKKNLIDSPISLEALKRQGLKPKDLLILTKKQAKKILQVDDDEILEAYLSKSESRRKKFLKLVKKERNTLLNLPQDSLSLNSGPSKSSASNFFFQDSDKHLQKLRKKQEIELAQMLEHEKIKFSIQKRFEARDKKSAEREAHRQTDLDQLKKIQESHRLQQVQIQKEKEEENERQRKILFQKEFVAEQKRIKKQRKEEKIRKNEAKKRDEESKMKQVTARLQFEEIMNEQQAKVEKRRKKMELKEYERLRAMEEKQKELKTKNEAKQKEKNKRLELAKRNLEEIVNAKMENFWEKQKNSEIKRMQFERRREEMKEEAKKRAKAKKKEIEEVVKSNNEMQEERKKRYLRTISEAEKRKKKLENQARIELERKQEEDRQKEEERLQVLEKQKEIEQERVRSIREKQIEADQKLKALKDQQDEEARRMAVWKTICRKEKEAEIKRIKKKQKYEKFLIEQRIQEENQRTTNLMLEKQKIHEYRLEVRKQLDKEKEIMMKNFIKAQKSLNSDQAGSEHRFLNKKHKPKTTQSTARTASGWASNSNFYSTSVLTTKKKNKKNSNQAKKKNKNAMKEFNEEERKEVEREKILSCVTNPGDRRRLEKVFENEREKVGDQRIELEYKLKEDFQKAKNHYQKKDN